MKPDNFPTFKGLLGVLDSFVDSALKLMGGFMAIWFCIVVPFSIILFGLYALGVLD